MHATETTTPVSPRYDERMPPTGWPLVPILIALFVAGMAAGAYWLTLPVGAR